MTVGYEALRAQATGTADAAPRGLALLLSSGLPAWLAAWRSLVSAPPASPSAQLPSKPVAAFGLGSELAVLLAEMVLSGPRRCRS